MKVVYTKVVSFIRVQVHTLAGVAILGGHKGTPPTILWLATYMIALPYSLCAALCAPCPLSNRIST